jgi:CubicO group peptidase (beta-lactamase class C family)
VSSLIERFLAARVAEGWTPGAAWWVARGGRTVESGALGHATTLPGLEPLSENTPFDLASLTKPLATATLLVLAEQDGLLDLERPVGEFLDELSGSPWQGTTLLDLATHTSGLPAWKPLCAEADSAEGYLRAIADTPRAVSAGTTVYSDLGYILLGETLARVSNEPLAELFHRRIAEPLGLKRTGFAEDPASFADAAATEQGNRYERDLAGSAGERFAWRETLIRGVVHDANAYGLGGVAGHAGLFAPIEELARLGGELLRPRRLALGARARDRLLGVVPNRGGRTVGFVAARRSTAAEGILPGGSPGHTGFTGTSIWLDPSRDLLFVLLANRVHPVVSRRNFQLVRRGFHRLALGAASQAVIAPTREDP